MLLFYNDLDNMDKNLLLTAIRASLEAGSEIMSVYTDPNADFEIEKKADNSPLTIADRKSHMVIAARLASTPYPVLSEEGKKIPVEERQSWNELWIVDPLDGTKEFIKRNGEFTVNIAYVKNGKPEAGAARAGRARTADGRKAVPRSHYLRHAGIQRAAGKVRISGKNLRFRWKLGFTFWMPCGILNKLAQCAGAPALSSGRQPGFYTGDSAIPAT